MTNQWFEANRLERRWPAIRRALTQRGTNLTQLADSNQLSNLRTAERRSFPAAEAVIAEALQVTVEALFPERYGVQWSAVAQQAFDALLEQLSGATAAQAGMEGFGLHVAQWETRPQPLQECPRTEPGRLRWIKARLQQRQFVLEHLAHHAGVTRKVFDSLGRSPHVGLQLLIARCLGVSPRELWPERYGRDGRALGSDIPDGEHQERQVPEASRLSLGTGLWLPLREVVGLPGLHGRFNAIRRRAQDERWILRVRFEVTEVLFTSLPPETKAHLLDVRSDPDIASRVEMTYAADPVPLSCSDQTAAPAANVAAIEGGVRLGLVGETGQTLDVRICRRAVPSFAIALLGQGRNGT
ncbi:helix-turn-helix domain-containing protein [Pseudomonas sp. CBMAI 2609]|uniref:Helix-turn-helix domain-containing protein n=1 Tax=Pseudomonas flavocrustae TaxID=2991719 RepID=A0ABT6IJH7_9PSED|nr:helix-turn-helix domain-containing protein [Pseudomonas sp. CBMAI 2609]MDH4764307.1 helix-turn-helix domain-containing protein [Pseudomonas sp. CBMAI 2609]